MLQKQIHSAHKFKISESDIDASALDVIHKLTQQGYDAYIVGGAVRDLILGVKPKDFDVVTSATPEQIRRVFRNSIIIGKRFKLVHVYYNKINKQLSTKHKRNVIEKNIIEVSTFRSTTVLPTQLNEHGKIVFDNNYGTMAEDAVRRDFTINALFYDVINAQIIDYHDGITDLLDRKLHIIGKPSVRYCEDPVRIIRAIRLSVKLGIQIADNTADIIEEVKHLLLNESKARLYEEMLKILISGHSIAVIDKLGEFGIPRGVFPVLDKIDLSDKTSVAFTALDKTDKRVQSGEDVSLSFVVACLLWEKVKVRWDKFSEENNNSKQALFDAVSSWRDSLINMGISRVSLTVIRDIWLLQAELEQPKLKNLTSTLEHRRLRPAIYLLNLRGTLDNVDSVLNQLWLDYLEERISVVDLANNLIEYEAKEPVKKKRKRKKAKKESLI